MLSHDTHAILFRNQMQADYDKLKTDYELLQKEQSQEKSDQNEVGMYADISLQLNSLMNNSKTLQEQLEKLQQELSTLTEEHQKKETSMTQQFEQEL